MGGVGEEALEGVARGPVPVRGRLGPELHSEVVPRHVDHAGVEGVVVGELQSSSLEARAALQRHKHTRSSLKDPDSRIVWQARQCKGLISIDVC